MTEYFTEAESMILGVAFEKAIAAKAQPPKKRRSATWKHGERMVAKILTDLGFGESERVPVTGRTRGSAPDIRNPRFSIEQKHRKTLPKLVTGAFDQAIKSIRGNQIPIVILHEHGDQYLDSLVVVRLRDLPHLFSEVVE